MKQQQLLYLGSGFVLLLLIWLLFIRDTSPTTFKAAPEITVPTDQVNMLTVAFPTDTVAVERQGTRWVMVRPVTAIADSNTVSRFLQQIGDMALDAPVTGDVARHAYYGFDSTASRINLRWGDEGVFDLTVSRQGPDYQSVYVQIGDDPRIYSTRQRITVQQNADRWRDRRIMTQSSATVQSAVVSQPGSTYEVTRTDTGWSVDGVAADSMSVENWLRRFSVFNADGFYDDIPKLVLQDATYQISFTSTAGTTEQLTLMQTEDALAVATSAKDPTYRILASRLESYFPDPSTFFSE